MFHLYEECGLYRTSGIVSISLALCCWHWWCQPVFFGGGWLTLHVQTNPCVSLFMLARQDHIFDRSFGTASEMTQNMQLISIQSEIGEFNSNSIKSYEVLMPYCVQLVTSWASQLVPMTLSLADPMEADLFPLLGLGHPYRPYRKPYVFFWNISYIHTCRNRDKTWKNQSRLARWEACYSLRHHDAIHAVVGPAGPWCRCPPDGTHLPWLRGPRQQLCRCHTRRFGEEARKRLCKHNPCGKGRGNQRRSWQVDSTSPGFAAGDVFFQFSRWWIHQNWGIHWIYIYISYFCPLWAYGWWIRCPRMVWWCSPVKVDVPGCSLKPCWLQGIRVGVDETNLVDSPAKVGIYLSDGRLAATSQVLEMPTSLQDHTWFFFPFFGYDKESKL